MGIGDKAESVITEGIETQRAGAAVREGDLDAAGHRIERVAQRLQALDRVGLFNDHGFVRHPLCRHVAADGVPVPGRRATLDSDHQPVPSFVEVEQHYAGEAKHSAQPVAPLLEFGEGVARRVNPDVGAEPLLGRAPAAVAYQPDVRLAVLVVEAPEAGDLRRQLG